MNISLSVTKKQKDFIDAEESEVLFGGAAGGGKSYGQTVDALLFALKYPGSKQLILRRTFAELEKSLIRLALSLYPRAIYSFNASNHTGKFKNGSIIDFGYCLGEGDVFQYQSAEYDVIRFDELTHFTESQYVYLISRVRGANNFPKQVKSSTNPGGIGHGWVKARFVAAITLTVAALVTFTDAALSGMGAERFTTTLTVMLISSYLMYFSLEDTGEREGESTKEYQAALSEYRAARSKITPEHIDPLRNFCLDYSRRELEYRRLCFLGERGYSLSQLQAYRDGEKFPRRAARTFKRAESLRAIKLSPAMLMSADHTPSSELRDPRGRKLLDALTSLIPSTLATVFTVSVIITAKDGMTLSTVLDGIVKLSALPIIGFKGMLDGFRFCRVDRSAWLSAKAGIIRGFLKEREGGDALGSDI